VRLGCPGLPPVIVSKGPKGFEFDQLRGATEPTDIPIQVTAVRSLAPSPLVAAARNQIAPCFQAVCTDRYQMVVCW
jgi:hypothetical protein